MPCSRVRRESTDPMPCIGRNPAMGRSALWQGSAKGLHWVAVAGSFPVGPLALPCEAYGTMCAAICQGSSKGVGELPLKDGGDLTGLRARGRISSFPLKDMPGVFKFPGRHLNGVFNGDGQSTPLPVKGQPLGSNHAMGLKDPPGGSASTLPLPSENPARNFHSWRQILGVKAARRPKPLPYI